MSLNNITATQVAEREKASVIGSKTLDLDIAEMEQLIKLMEEMAGEPRDYRRREPGERQRRELDYAEQRGDNAEVY